MQFQVLILDDESMVCNSLKRILESDERKIFIANQPETAFKILGSNPIDLLLLDYQLGEKDGLEILKDIKAVYADVEIIMITAYGNIEIAVEAMKNGAFDFIQKKEEPSFIRYNVQRALDTLRLKKEVEELKSQIKSESALPKIIANSKTMKSILGLASEFAKSDSIILINGETGTGKSLIAEHIHHLSNRFNGSFVSINCSAIPSELIESELFGYEKGAFTGAHQKGKKGLIEQANNGTLFLDEIGELNLDMQTKLLHVLEKNSIIRLGAVEPIKINVRFIAATNSILSEKVNNKTFRMDLFYRLNVASFTVPPLRERKEDIMALAKSFVDMFNKKFNKRVIKFSPEIESFLITKEWYGNVRELRNYIERAMLLKKGDELQLNDFDEITKNRVGQKIDGDINNIKIKLDTGSQKNLLHEAQKEVILYALKSSNNNISQAAQMLGIPRTSLNSCIQRFNISK